MTTKHTLPALVAFALLTFPNAYAARVTLPVNPDGGFADIIERTLPSVVQVVTAGSGPRAKAGEGSGVIISADGYLLTNQHVVEGAANITIRLSDERELPAKLIAADAPPTSPSSKSKPPASLPSSSATAAAPASATMSSPSATPSASAPQ